MKIVIVGGVAAGTKTAARLKRINPQAEIMIITKGRDISYAGCGLPYYVGGLIQEREELIVNTPEKFSGLTGARVLNEREVYELDAASKKVLVRNLRNGAQEEYEYDSCIIACGASAIVPPIEGTALSGVYVMRTPQDAIDAREYLEKNEAKRAVVVGGGYIGLEMAENLLNQGLAVTVVEAGSQIMPSFDYEMADFAKRHLVRKGIRVLTGTKVEAIEGNARVEKVVTGQGSIPADMVILAAGIRPNTAFLKDTGIEMAANGTILTDEQMKTSIEDVYAAGDCAAVLNRMTGKLTWSPMGSSANLEGRVLANVIGSREAAYKGVLGTGIVKLPELNAGRTGLSEKEAKEAGMDVATVVIMTDDKAHYYPGADSFAIKLIAEKNSYKLLGAQVFGPGSVDKVVDVAAVALTMGATLDQLNGLDLAYAPPFSTAIHPFVTAVNVLMNKMNGDMISMTPAEYLEGAAEGYRLLDTAKEPSITGVKYIDLTKVEQDMAGIDKDEKLLIVCTRGKRAYMLQKKLEALGYGNTVVLEGASKFNEIKVPRTLGVVTVSAEDITRVKALGFLHNKGTDNFSARVITRNGKITAEESQCIAEAARLYGNGEITMTSRLTVELPGVPFDKIEDIRAHLATAGLETGGTGSKVRPVVSCKGTTCQYGLLDTFGLSEKIHERFYHGYAGVKLPHKFKIAVGGCPNNCVKPDLNDFGIIGQRVPVFNAEACKGCTVCSVDNSCPMSAVELAGGNGRILEDICNNCGRCVGKCPFGAMNDDGYGYRVYIGGRWGKKVAKGQMLSPVFRTEEEVLSVLEKAILLFREQGQTGERFADTIQRIGFENVEAQLLSDEILTRREQIIGAKLHLVGGATC